jgi:hypothetical protein
MRKAVLSGIAAAAAASAGCGEGRAENGGPTVQRSYQVGAFQQIEVAGPFDVQVRTGAGPSVSASGPEKLIERLVVEVRGDKLVIHTRRDKSWFGGWRDHGNATIQVTAPALRGAALVGSGDMVIDQVKGADFSGSVAGSGDLRVETVDVQNLKLSIAGSGDLSARSGRAKAVDLSIAGSGDIDAGGVRSETASASIAGSGNIRGQATGTADVSIMGSGGVTLTGGAKCSISKAGSGSANCS